MATYDGSAYRENRDLRCNKMVKTWWIAHDSRGKPRNPICKTYEGTPSLAQIWDLAIGLATFPHYEVRKAAEAQLPTFSLR